jgi:hypothetical protein
VDEKFEGAVDTLTTSFAPNWVRMSYALNNLIVLLPNHFPDRDLFERYERLWKQMTDAGPLMIGDRIYSGSIENTLRKRRRITFERYAKELVEISIEIKSRRGQYTD